MAQTYKKTPITICDDCGRDTDEAGTITHWDIKEPFAFKGDLCRDDALARLSRFIARPIRRKRSVLSMPPNVHPEQVDDREALKGHVKPPEKPQEPR